MIQLICGRHQEDGTIQKQDKQYIFYTFGERAENNQMKMYVSILEEDETKVTLKGIEDDNEWDVVKEILDSMYKEEND